MDTNQYKPLKVTQMQDSFSVQHATSGIRDGMIDQTKSMLQK
jgi:hypothetical protein